MIQKSLLCNTIEDCEKALTVIHDELISRQYRDALMLVLVTGFGSDEISRLLNTMDEVLPEVKRVGISEYSPSENAEDRRIKLNLLMSESSEFYVRHFPCMEGEEDQYIVQLRNAINEIPYVKGIGLFPIRSYLDVTKILVNAFEDHPEIPVFGAMASSRNMAFHGITDEKDVYGIAGGIADCGFICVFFAGEELKVEMDYMLGWHPLGKEMEFICGEKNRSGEGCISMIDGKAAIEIYRKYLGVTWDENFVLNICEFPLMIQRNGADICMVPSAKSDDGSLYFSGPAYENEKIRFSYATRDDVLGASYEGLLRMIDFGAEAIFLSLCGNRVNYLRDDAHIEWDNYRVKFPELLYCHGNYEISYQNGQGGVLNSSFITVGFKEHPEVGGIDSVPPEIELSDKEGPIPLVYRMSQFLHVMTEELTHFQHHLEDEVEKKTRENEGLSFHVVQTLAETIDAKDTYTNGHSGRVAKYSREIAKRAGLSEKAQNEIFMMGILHDVGKIGVPDTVINKPGRLTDEEFEAVKTHPETGARILDKIKEMPGLAIGAHWHHERVDGRGYPDGLKGTEIPREARIIAVADAYDAMTSNRSYRDVMPQEKVREQIVNGLGSQFDPGYGRIMLEMIDEDIDYQMRETKKKVEVY